MTKHVALTFALGAALASHGALADITAATEPSRATQLAQQQAAPADKSKATPQAPRPAAEARTPAQAKPSVRDTLYGADPKNPYHELTEHSN